ncbi:MAG TPA: M23 family metallopeptidase [Steroidobacteraceae bacterium]|nr:M23 family metallopeptidase [Steroidobacteraceae bacterium]
MNIIFFSKREGLARQLNLAHPLTLTVLAVLVVGILGTAFALGMQLGQGSNGRVARGESARWSAILADQKHQISELKERMNERVDAMAMRMGEVNAHVIRLDALGKRLTEMADIDSHEFDFDSAPPSGGPEALSGISAQIPDLSSKLQELEQRVALRDSQLSALENVILARELKEQTHPEGRPVAKGFISSYFGEREDPFSGEEAYHKGVDFAGTEGANVMAVAAGVVTWAGNRTGYGNLVEINHGDGYVTRYAHNERTLVSVGQTVKRGDAIALMGSTGRSTGPHVHFEVLRNGRQIDPLSFIGR